MIKEKKTCRWQETNDIVKKKKMEFNGDDN